MMNISEALAEAIGAATLEKRSVRAPGPRGKTKSARRWLMRPGGSEKATTPAR